MAGNDSAAWDLLPHDPEGFFGLQGSYDRRDLKRKYNGFIRRFKPEKFPNEFKQIRAAYEALDHQLRYGERAAAEMPNKTAPAAWVSPVSFDIPIDQADSQEHTAQEKVAPSITLERQLETAGAEAVYAVLRGKENKTPYDFFALAVLSDVVVTESPNQFLRWLLEGLREYPDEPGLANLMSAYCRGPIPAETIGEVLVDISTVVKDQFFYITEPLWDVLLKGTPFDEFKRTLSNCERNLDTLDIHNRLTFYLHILKSALWKADNAWIQDVFVLLEENYEDIPEHLEYDFDLLDQLRAYKEQSSAFVQGNPLRERLHRVIRDFCTQDEEEADRRFLECQVQLVAEGQELLDAFPSGMEDCAAFWSAWLMIADDVGERMGEPHGGVEPTDLQQRVHEAMKRAEKRSDKSLRGKLWTVFNLSYYGILFLTVLFLFSLGLTIGMTLGSTIGWSESVQVVLGLALGAGVAAAFWFVLKPRTFDWLLAWVGEWFARGVYRAQWRVEVLQLMKQTCGSRDDIKKRIEAIEDSELGFIFWIPEYLDDDYGLAIFETAQRFSR